MQTFCFSHLPKLVITGAKLGSSIALRPTSYASFIYRGFQYLHTRQACLSPWCTIRTFNTFTLLNVPSIPSKSIYFSMHEAMQQAAETDKVLVAVEVNKYETALRTTRQFCWFQDYKELRDYLLRCHNTLRMTALHEILLDSSPRTLFFDLDGKLPIIRQSHTIWISQLTSIVHWFFGIDKDETTNALRPTVIRGYFADNYSAHVIFPYIQFENLSEQMEILPLLLNTIYCLNPINDSPILNSNENTLSSSFAMKQTDPIVLESTVNRPIPDSVNTLKHETFSDGNQLDDVINHKNKLTFQSWFHTKSFKEKKKLLSTQRHQKISQKKHFPFEFNPPLSTTMINSLDSVTKTIRLHDIIDRQIYGSSRSLRTPYSCKLIDGEYNINSLLSVEHFFNQNPFTGFIGYCNQKYRLNSRHNISRLLFDPLIQQVIESFGFTPQFQRLLDKIEYKSQQDTFHASQPTAIWLAMSPGYLGQLSGGLWNPSFRYCVPKLNSVSNTQHNTVVANQNDNTVLLNDKNDLKVEIMDVQDFELIDLFSFCLHYLHHNRCSDWLSWWVISGITATLLLSTNDPKIQTQILFIFLDWSKEYQTFDLEENISVIISFIEKRISNYEFEPDNLTLLFYLVDADNASRMKFIWPTEDYMYSVKDTGTNQLALDTADDVFYQTEKE